MYLWKQIRILVSTPLLFLTPGHITKFGRMFVVFVLVFLDILELEEFFINPDS